METETRVEDSGHRSNDADEEDTNRSPRRRGSEGSDTTCHAPGHRKVTGDVSHTNSATKRQEHRRNSKHEGKKNLYSVLYISPLVPMTGYSIYCLVYWAGPLTDPWLNSPITYTQILA
jgi:hypothetical protein